MNFNVTVKSFSHRSKQIGKNLKIISQIQEGAECGRLTPPPAMNSNKAGLGAIKSAQSALQLKSNTLKAKPTIIITSGSSTDTSPAEAKSTASEGVEGATSAGMYSSPYLM